ncbi:ankyrin repeat domain-containing protein [Cohnella sp. GCM10012308]|uniref:ankyrin repeat domain-containing protein n=1 Tax=Cohnella sp. GCM10012308 TaxID=3317329 RepID=UPI003609756D
MEFIYEDETLAKTVVQAIQAGDILYLKQLLIENPGLARTRIAERDHTGESDSGSKSRTLLHVVADWPGHFPNGSAAVGVLIEFGAEVNARFTGSNTETPLHWAASSDDIALLDALLDAGADIEASGAVIAGGTPLDDAVAFAQWHAARRLVERGAAMALWHAAALGKMDAIKADFTGNALSEKYPWGASSASPPDKVTVAFWCACHGGQRQSAEYLFEQGAELNWLSVWDGLTPLDAAHRSSAADLVHWLRSKGAKFAREL